MIHHTLLPVEYAKTLKRDYRIRIVITLMLFIALGIVIGILCLLPSYIISFSQEKDLVNKVEAIQKDRESNGVGAMMTELNSSYSFVKKLKNEQSKILFTASLEEILALRIKNISLTSFEVASSSQELGMSELIIQGKALTRDSLLAFKKSIESDPRISKVELPISDLAKSKDIPFAMKFTLQNVK